MAVLKGYVKAMGGTRKEYKTAWLCMASTMIKHIIKAILIIDDDRLKTWLKELDHYLEGLVDAPADSVNFKKPNIYQELEQLVSVSHKGVARFVRSACESYLQDESSVGKLKLRHYTNKALADDINAVTAEFVSLLKVIKQSHSSYPPKSVQAMVGFKAIRDSYSDDCIIISNPAKQIR